MKTMLLQRICSSFASGRCTAEKMLRREVLEDEEQAKLFEDALDALTPDDIDVVSKKYSTGTQRCYMRAQKGVDAITIGAVKSIQATLTVAKDGSVTDVALASHSEDNLGKCLITALKGWRFRPNPGQRVKFTLAFAQQ